VTVVVGVDGAGRTHRLERIVAEAAGPVVRVTPATNDLAGLLARAATDGALVVVDDAHRLAPGDQGALADAARRGVSMIISRRPSIGGRELADLDEAVAATGRVEQLGPLDPATIGVVAGAASGQPLTPEAAAALHEACGGMPAIAAAAALAPSGTPSASLVARVQRRLALLDPPVAGLTRLLALRLDLGDQLLAAAAGLDPDGLAVAMRTLRDEGLLMPASELMIPAVAAAILTELPPAERRRMHDAIAHALVQSGSDPLAAAIQLRAARARTPTSAQMYRAAGDRVRFDDPAAAIGWYDDAVESGFDPAALAAGRAEAAALLGMPVDNTLPLAGEDAARLALVDGAVQAHQGRAARSAQVLAAAPPPGPTIGVPALVATGDLATARAAPASGPGGLDRLAEAVLAAAADPGPAVPLLIEAAETVERTPPLVVLPDTPHALGALVAVTAGDGASADHLLERALDVGVGGPVAVARHRLLLAWARLRVGRFDTAVAELARHANAALPGRERLLLAALSAGVARRSGDIAQLRDAWTAVEPALARQAVDLFAAEALEELLVAAVRLRHEGRIDPVLDALDDIVGRLGRPVAWVISIGWIRLQLAVSVEDAAGAAAAAAMLAAAAHAAGPTRAAGSAASAGSAGAALGARQRAQVAAAAMWAPILAGEVDADAVMAVAAELAAAEMPWEASRLVGQAAIRTTDPAAARRLLERARELSSAEVVPPDGRAETQRGGLSEREVEVARMVLAGGTYREIGSRLFISPKTVEHHVARIRTKLGATTRAEFVAALREVLADGAA
jgi:DNA-binding CsgD family transcriptional regulator